MPPSPDSRAPRPTLHPPPSPPGAPSDAAASGLGGTGQPRTPQPRGAERRTRRPARGTRRFLSPAAEAEPGWRRPWRRRGSKGSPGGGQLGVRHTHILTAALRPGSTNQEPRRGDGRGGASTNEVGRRRPRGLGRRGGTSGENRLLGVVFPSPPTPALSVRRRSSC